MTNKDRLRIDAFERDWMRHHERRRQRARNIENGCLVIAFLTGVATMAIIVGWWS